MTQAAVELALNNTTAAREALTDMPPRNEDELDPVCLCVIHICIVCIYIYIYYM